MALFIKYDDLRDKNTFAVHTIDIKKSLFGEDIMCQVRYVRVAPFVKVDEVDEFILSAIRSCYGNVQLTSSINTKNDNETYHDHIRYSHLFKVPVSIFVEAENGNGTAEYKHMRIDMEFYCENAEHIEFFNNPISYELRLNKEQWDALSHVANSQYMRFSYFF